MSSRAASTMMETLCQNKKGWAVAQWFAPPGSGKSDGSLYLGEEIKMKNHCPQIYI